MTRVGSFLSATRTTLAVSGVVAKYRFRGSRGHGETLMGEIAKYKCLVFFWRALEHDGPLPEFEEWQHPLGEFGDEIAKAGHASR